MGDLCGPSYANMLMVCVDISIDIPLTENKTSLHLRFIDDIITT